MANNSKAIKEKRKKDMKTAAYFGTAVALLAVLIVGVIVGIVNFNSNKTVLTVGEHKVKKDLYTCVYYCETIASNDWKQFGFDISKDPYKQEFDYKYAGKDYESWGKYFESLTKDTLKYYLVMCDTAEKGGYEYTSEVETHINTELAAIDEEKGTAKNFRMYMIENYGADVSRKTYKKYLNLHYKAAEFFAKITESKAMFNKYIGGDSQSFESVYNENRDEIDVVSFRYFYLTDNETNAQKIKQLASASNEEEFKNLCNEFKNDEEYEKNDSSLFENFSLLQINTLSKGSLADKISSFDCKSGEIYTDKAEIKGKNSIEFLYIVKPRGKDTSPYNDSSVANWEYRAMSIMLEDYYETNYKLAVSEKGLESFKESMIIAD